MHIAVVTRNLSAGGAERVIAQLISKWNDWGVTCSLVSMYPTQSFYCVPEAVQAYDIDASENSEATPSGCDSGDAGGCWCLYDFGNAWHGNTGGGV